MCTCPSSSVSAAAARLMQRAQARAPRSTHLLHLHGDAPAADAACGGQEARGKREVSQAARAALTSTRTRGRRAGCSARADESSRNPPFNDPRIHLVEARASAPPAAGAAPRQSRRAPRSRRACAGAKREGGEGAREETRSAGPGEGQRGHLYEAASSEAKRCARGAHWRGREALLSSTRDFKKLGPLTQVSSSRPTAQSPASTHDLWVPQASKESWRDLRSQLV